MDDHYENWQRFPYCQYTSGALRPSTNAKNDLALNILEDHFGDQTREVALRLMVTYNCTLQILTKYFQNVYPTSSRLTSARIKQILMMLHQHRCLIIQLPPRSDIIDDITSYSRRGESQFVYSIEVEMVVNRLGIARMVSHGYKTEECGEIGSLLIEELIMNGRCTLQRLIEYVQLYVEKILRDAEIDDVESLDKYTSQAVLAMNKSHMMNSQDSAMDDENNTKSEKGDTSTHSEPPQGPTRTREDLQFISGTGMTKERQYLLKKNEQQRHEYIHEVFSRLVERGFIHEAPKMNIMHKPAAIKVKHVKAKSSAASGAGEASKSTRGKVKEEKDKEMQFETQPSGSTKGGSSRIRYGNMRVPIDNDEDAGSDGDDQQGLPKKKGRLTKKSSKDAAEDSEEEALVFDHQILHPNQIDPNAAKDGRKTDERGKVSKTIDDGDESEEIEKDTTTKRKRRMSEVTETDAKPSATGKNVRKNKANPANAGSVAPVKNDPETLWTVNWTQLVVEERNQICAKYIGERSHSLVEPENSQLCHRIIQLLLEESDAKRRQGLRARVSEHGTQNEVDINERKASMLGRFSESITVKSICERHEMSTAYGGDGAINVEKVSYLLLSRMDQEFIRIIQRNAHSKALEEFAVDIEGILGKVRLQSIRDIATMRYGMEGGRIVSMFLEDKRWIDQQDIGDKVILPPRTARESLYSLYRDQWVDFKEVSKRSDYNPQNTSYFWKGNEEHIKNRVLDQCYRGIVNLRLKSADILKRAEEKDIEMQAILLYKSCASEVIRKGTTERANTYRQSGRQVLSYGHSSENGHSRATNGVSNAHLQGSASGMEVAIGRIDLAIQNLYSTVIASMESTEITIAQSRNYKVEYET